MNPEGLNKNVKFCKNKKDLQKQIQKGKKVCGKIVLYNPQDMVFTVKLCSKDNIIGYLKSDDNSFGAKSLVGHIIECTVIYEKETYVCYRNIEDAKSYCLKKYKVGSLVVGKVITFLSTGAIIDIGGGCQTYLHKSSALPKTDHISEILKTGDTSNFRIIEIKENKIYIELVF